LQNVRVDTEIPLWKPERRLNWTEFMKRLKFLITSGLAIALAVMANPALAGDPFRNNNPRPIDDQTEAIFRAMFEEGNYVRAQELLENGDATDPMAYAIQGAFAFMEEDWDTLLTQSRLTLEAAEDLVATDPLRGNLYLAVGHFLEGAHALLNEGTLRGTPTALRKLQLVFNHMGEAERIDRTDPEFNLVKGYMDLMLAVNLPFADPNQAIQRFENYAAPDYLSKRGMALAYRDLDQQDQALEAVEQAIASAPSNPELYYLKAQILVQSDQDAASLEFFDQALEKWDQLPLSAVEQIAWERCRAESRVENEDRNCRREVNKFLEARR
jgi:tetratricopeptide (TPR) repeat protein